MKLVRLGCVLWGSLLLAGSPEQDANVNTRYTVESVELSGDKPADISTGLRSELVRMVGEKLNPSALDDLARRIRRELHVRAVSHRVLRGQTPEHVRVVFDVRGRPARFEASVPKFLYGSQSGFSGAVEGTATVGSRAWTIGLVSDGDELLERYTGVVARLEDTLASNRVRLRFQFASYREQWDSQTIDAVNRGPAAPSSALYGTRQDLEPVATFLLARPLTLSVGASFERLQPLSPATRTEMANAIISTLHYHRHLEGEDANQQDWDAAYNLRAATSLLASDFAYVRHLGEVRYVYSWGRSEISDTVNVGLLTGRAPLFERFVAGNGSLLRGWNKFELDPLGGSRLVHNSVAYRYGKVEVFYDSGALWDPGQTAVIRHSLGIGIRQNGLCVALAFPVREGHIEPVFMVGMNY